MQGGTYREINGVLTRICATVPEKVFARVEPATEPPAQGETPEATGPATDQSAPRRRKHTIEE